MLCHALQVDPIKKQERIGRECVVSVLGYSRIGWAKYIPPVNPTPRGNMISPCTQLHRPSLLGSSPPNTYCNLNIPFIFKPILWAHVRVGTSSRSLIRSS